MDVVSCRSAFEEFEGGGSECGNVPFEEGSKALLLFVEPHFPRSPHSCWLQRGYRGLFEWWAAFFFPIRLEKKGADQMSTSSSQCCCAYARRGSR
jgi:hypothetical protein